MVIPFVGWVRSWGAFGSCAKLVATLGSGVGFRVIPVRGVWLGRTPSAVPPWDQGADFGGHPV